MQNFLRNVDHLSFQNVPKRILDGFLDLDNRSLDVKLRCQLGQGIHSGREYAVFLDLVQLFFPDS